MRYLELSIKDTEEASKQLAQKISQDFKPDVVVFIAKGSYIIGDVISKYFEVPLIEIHAVREGNKLKNLVSPVLKLIPKSVKNYLRKKELQSGVHNKNSERRVYLEKGKDKLQDAENILVVDDSVDTGHTAKQVCEYIIRNFGEKTMRFASLNVFAESERIFRVHYSLYKNCIMIGPWSKDSEYYCEFIMRYEQWKKS
ncbi:phosphoribosyltransferase [Geobacillus jurassicus]|uniref:Phosphoribosyltransferase n=1 Tax=Geobacillus jurassicus TaxID=235932 RepID=A0ABV6GPX1_9BACL|nr:phosphoribosyltransferase [Geobacillus jurassicus]